MRRMRIRATATTTMMNVPKGVARSMALSQISVASVEPGSSFRNRKKYTTVGIFLSCNAYCTLYLKDPFLTKSVEWKTGAEEGLRN